MKRRLKWPATLKRSIEMSEHDVQKTAKKAGIHFTMLYTYLRGESLPALDKLIALAKALGVREAYLAVGEEPMSADAWSVGNRALFQVTGYAKDWDQPSSTKSREDREMFEKAFGRETGLFYRSLSPTVREIFGNVFARIMESYRKYGIDIADADWRGGMARQAFEYYEARGRESEPDMDYDERGATTRAWLVAMTTDMERWEDGQMPDDAFPLD